MLLREDTQQIQSSLARYCRTGDLQPITGAKTERLPHYRRLVFNVVFETLSRAYPIAQNALGDVAWKNLVDRFFSTHNAASPQVWKLPYEFYEYCVDENLSEEIGRPYLNELLYFEWIEIEIHTMPDEDIPEYKSEGDLLDDLLIINPEHQLLHFEYPVHKMNTNKLTKNRGNYFVLIYREQEDLSVKFFDFSPFFALVFENLTEQGLTGREALIQAGLTLKMKDADQIIQNGIAFLNDLTNQGIILGFSVD